MRGHDQLIAMRMRGRVPRYGVCIATDPQDIGWPAAWQTLCMLWGAHPDTAELYIDPTEPIRRLDLRPLVGLSVQVRGCDPARVREVFDAAQHAGAKRVIGVVNRRAAGELMVVEIFDSEGLKA